MCMRICLNAIQLPSSLHQHLLQCTNSTLNHLAESYKIKYALDFVASIANKLQFATGPGSPLNHGSVLFLSEKNISHLWVEKQ